MDIIRFIVEVESPDDDPIKDKEADVVLAQMEEIIGKHNMTLYDSEIEDDTA